MTQIRYPEIEALEAALATRGLLLSLEPEDEALRARSYRRIRVRRQADGLTASIPVDDEYGDAREDNQPLLLHLVLAERECFEEAGDFRTWAREQSLDPDASLAAELYRELGEVVPKIRDLVGPDVKPLTSWDFGLNAGAARALRDR